MTYRLFAVLALSFLVTACGNEGMNLYPYKDPNFTREKFAVCHGFNCYYRTEGWITDKQWKKVKAAFKPAAKNAEEERTQIATAIARMETYAGLSSGLNQDRAKAETFEENRITQMDCIDETINADMYLDFIAEAGLLKFHETHDPVHRGYFIDGAWPHNSAAIQEKETGTVYVVDTYYKAHGEEPYIMPLSIWAAFWRPEDDQMELPASKPVR